MMNILQIFIITISLHTIVHNIIIELFIVFSKKQ